MSAIDEIKCALETCAKRPDRMNFSALELMIATALADARREGAEQMRAESAKLARALPLYYGSGDDGADESLAQAIEDLPLPTGERQAVRLTDEQIEYGRKQVFSTDNPFCPCEPKTMRKAARWAEAAVLAANGLEVRRG